MTISSLTQIEKHALNRIIPRLETEQLLLNNKINPTLFKTIISWLPLGALVSCSITKRQVFSCSFSIQRITIESYSWFSAESQLKPILEKAKLNLEQCKIHHENNHQIAAHYLKKILLITAVAMTIFGTMPIDIPVIGFGILYGILVWVGFSYSGAPGLYPKIIESTPTPQTLDSLDNVIKQMKQAVQESSS